MNRKGLEGDKPFSFIRGNKLGQCRNEPGQKRIGHTISLVSSDIRGFWQNKLHGLSI